MTDQQPPATFGAEPAAVASCWMCGIRLSAYQMVPDGGAACLDLRWYCRDTRACTQRWTSRSGRRKAINRGMSGPAKTPDKQATDPDLGLPVLV
jgi:hypothetical protein